MSLINTQVKPFKATAFHAGEFVQVTDETLKGLERDRIALKKNTVELKKAFFQRFNYKP